MGVVHKFCDSHQTLRANPYYSHQHHVLALALQLQEHSPGTCSLVGPSTETPICEEDGREKLNDAIPRRCRQIHLLHSIHP
jgi:hypothetical protein